MTRGPIVPVVGGGPAGMSCALWLANYGLRPIIIERETALGGMARLDPFPNDWLLGRPLETGRQNAAAFAGHIDQAGIECLLATQPQCLRNEGGDVFTLELTRVGPAQAKEIACRALVIATGTRFRGEQWLEDVDNAQRLAASGRIHIGPTYAGEPGADLGAHVAVIGGGDNAFDVSRMLAEKGWRVTLVMRSASPRARPSLVEALRKHEAAGMARIKPQSSVAALADAGTKVSMRLKTGEQIEVDHIILLLGYQANGDASWLAELALEQDANGYLRVDDNMETSRPALFAVGDLANPRHPCVATAIAGGTVAAREIARRFAATADR
jgi:thioredoxin reductase